MHKRVLLLAATAVKGRQYGLGETGLDWTGLDTTIGKLGETGLHWTGHYHR